MRRPHATTPALLAALLLAAACGRCGAPQAGPPAERFVPSGVAGVVLIPRLAEAARQAAALHATLAALPGQEELRELRAALGAQLSFDPLDPASMAGAGLDPERGAAVAELARRGDEAPGAALLVLPVGDAGKFQALVTRLARERLGATEQGLENANGKPIEVWRRGAGEPALLAVATVERTALLSAGPGGPEALRAALALDPALSLEKSPSWQRARAALGDGGALLLFVPPGAGPLPGGLPSEGLAAGLSATARSLRLVAAALLGPQETRFRPLAGPGPGRADPTALDPATVVALRLSASPAATLRLAASSLPGGRAAEPLERLAEALDPPLDVGLALSPRADVAGLIAARGMIEPLRVVRVEVVAPVRAGAALAPLLDELAKGAGGGGQGGRWRIPAGQAEVEVTLAGPRLLLTAGPAGGLDALVARGAGQGWKPPTPAAAAALAGGLGGLVIDGDRLVSGVKALPPEAFGTGPDAVVARSLAEKLTAPGGGGTASLRADLPAGALRLSLDLELPPPETAR